MNFYKENRSGSKMLTGLFLLLIVLFTIIAGWLAYKNNFSVEIESILFKAIGAIAIAAYFMANNFLINSKKEIDFKVSVPVMYDPSSGDIFSPYSKKSNSLPEEGNMFKGLDDYNMKKLADRFQDMNFWKEIKLTGDTQIDFQSTDRMAYLEYILLCWLELEVNWLNISESIGFTHSGHSKGSGRLVPNPKLSKNIRLDQIENPNPFFKVFPAELTLPKGATLKREIGIGIINLYIKTDTGDLTITLMSGSGGAFSGRSESKLVQDMAKFAKEKTGNDHELPERLWAEYPIISFKYSVKRSSQFSDQAKKEIAWLNKIDISLFKDFSWDLLREYLSFDYKAALDLYRKYNEKSSRANDGH